MTLRCPACRKVNELTEREPRCARCGCDLRWLKGVVQAAERHLTAAASAVRGAQWAGALEHATRAWRLRPTPQAAQLACLAATGLNDWRALSHWLGCLESPDTE